VARAPIAPGTFGKITLNGQVWNDAGKWVKARPGVKVERWRAVATYCDKSGDRHVIERFDRGSKARAEQMVKDAVSRWDETRRVMGLQAESSFGQAAGLWLEQVDRDPTLSARTKEQYKQTHERVLKESDLCALRLSEANSVPVLRTFLQAVADRRGTASAKSVKSVVSNVLNLAIEDGALQYNATRELRRIVAKASKKPTQRDTSRAFTKKEQRHICEFFAQHVRANELDVTDIAWFMAGTAVRLGEALAQRWEDVDLSTGIVMVRGTKTVGSVGRISMPSWLTERLRKRAAERGRDGLVFPSPGTSDRTKVRDDRNVSRVFRAVFDEAGYPWATSHTFRRTVGTLIDEAGAPVTLARDALRHTNANTTMSHYFGKRGDTSVAALILEWEPSAVA
jgi:integrase